MRRAKFNEIFVGLAWLWPPPLILLSHRIGCLPNPLSNVEKRLITIGLLLDAIATLSSNIAALIIKCYVDLSNV